MGNVLLATFATSIWFWPWIEEVGHACIFSAIPSLVASHRTINLLMAEQPLILENFKLTHYHLLLAI